MPDAVRWIETSMTVSILDSGDVSLFDVHSSAPGPSGSIPITADMLLHKPSGDLFGWTQNAGMGWDPSRLGGPEVLLLSTHGGIRAPDGTPIALGYHTGHWEVGLLMEAAARAIAGAGAIPFAGYRSDHCDGRTKLRRRVARPAFVGDFGKPRSVLPIRSD